jgi:hypothetical protein
MNCYETLELNIMLFMWTKQWVSTFLLVFLVMNANDQFMPPCQVWGMMHVLWMWIALWLVPAHFGSKLHWLFYFLVLCNLTWLWAQLKSLNLHPILKLPHLFSSLDVKAEFSIFISLQSHELARFFTILPW